MIEVRAYPSSEVLARYLAEHILEGVLATSAAGPYLLGLPTGSTPMPLFAALIEQTSQLREDDRFRVLDRLQIVVMDDFIDMHTGVNVTPDDEWSAPTFIDREFLQPLSTALDVPRDAISPVLYPQVGFVGRLRDEILGLGGLACQVVATDPFEGHVAQNFSGQSFARNECEKMADLSPGFLQHHPWAADRYKGVTFDLLDFATMVCRHPSGRFELVITGNEKSEIMRSFLNVAEYRPALPLSFLWLFPDRTRLWTDLDASAVP